MLKRSDEAIRTRRAKFLPESPPKGHKAPNFRQACLKTEGSFRQSAPEMGFSDVILEKDGRRFCNRIS